MLVEDVSGSKRIEHGQDERRDLTAHFSQLRGILHARLADERLPLLRLHLIVKKRRRERDRNRFRKRCSAATKCRLDRAREDRAVKAPKTREKRDVEEVLHSA